MIARTEFLGCRGLGDPVMHRFQPATTSDARRFQQIAAYVAMLIGIGTLVGMASGIDVLIRWLPSSTSMNPIAALLLVSGAVAILLPPRAQRWAMPAVAATMIIAGAVKLGQTTLGRPLGVDQLVALALKQRNAVLPDALAPNTALAFVLVGAALAIGRTQRPLRAIMAQAFVIAALAIALMALVGFALDAAAINRLTFNRMAVNSAVGLVAIGMAIVSFNPAHGLMKLLLHGGPSGALARIALPICLVLPILLGIVRLSIANDFGLSTGDGVAIMVAGNIVLTLGLLWGSLILLLRSDAERRDKADALEVSEAQYRQAGRIGKMGHWLYDAVRDELHWTHEFRALLKLPADMKPNFQIMNARTHPDDRKSAGDMMIRARTLGEGWNRHFRLLTPDGEIQYAKSHGICRRGADGAVESIFGVLADITELEVARQGAEAASLAQANFLANMSHEIRTPLNGVLGFIDLVLDSELDPTQRRYLVLVRESAQELLKLLNDILDLSKVEAGHVEIAPQATDLRRTIRHAVGLMMPVAEQKKIALTVDIAPDFPAAVLVDAGRVRQILLNLLGNALKFTVDGRVAVSLRVDVNANSDGAPVLRMAIMDSGVGIPPERREAVFGAFVQADNSTSRRFGGSGLGLSISRQLAELMAGTITLDSAEGIGTTAELILPLVPTTAAAIETSDAADFAGRPGLMLGVFTPDPDVPAEACPAVAAPGRSILLVEDVELNRILVGEMLRRLGHRVEFAVNGAEAVEKADRLSDDPQAWDLIFMDIQMPVMNGKDAARAIRAKGGAARAIPIVALSANAFATETQESRDAGMNDHIVKPIGFAELRETIETWATKPPPRRGPRARRAA